MPHKPFAHDLQARDIYPETFIFLWEEFLTTKFGLWIDTRSSTDNTLHGSGRAVEKSGILLQTEKAAEASDGDFTSYMFRLEDVVAHLSVTNSKVILTTEKQKKSRQSKWKATCWRTFGPGKDLNVSQGS